MAMTKKMPIGLFMDEARAAYKRKDGYIMGSKGQNPKKWASNSWWFTQYSGSQKTKALYWRENASRVWDCNGMAEGIYQDWSGVDINTRARYNYSQWCGTKGSGTIPAKYRVEGAAVFWGTNASNIHHVAYLDEPVNASNPSGDWYIIEARGVMYGVVRTKISTRKPNYWGLMTKYFDYENTNYEPVIPQLGDRILRNGDEGEDVKQLQTNLIRLGYDCGSWGADGDFGDATEIAVLAFQKAYKLETDGEYGAKSHAAMTAALVELDKPVESPKIVVIEGGDCWIRAEAHTGGAKLGVARRGDKMDYRGETAENGWIAVTYYGGNGWVSGKYGKLVAE